MLFWSILVLNRHLERARIVFSIENEMSNAERKLDVNRYWTDLDGERYLQVEEVNGNYFHDTNIGREHSDKANIWK